MVAISLYRGNLHRVPDGSRRWLMPNPKISLKDFKSLLLRRSKSLSRLRTIITTSNPNSSRSPNPSPNSPPKAQTEAPAVDGSILPVQPEAIKVSENEEGPSRQDKDHKESELVGPSFKKPEAGTDSFVDSKIKVPEKVLESVNGGATSTKNQIVLIRDKGDLSSEKEKRRQEVEDKLQVLNGKKHNLVLVLKQILNAEEELKRQSSMQGTAMRPSVTLQADGTNDTGSIGKHGAPRISSEANLGDDVEGVAADDIPNHNIPSRHMLRTSSMSPSSESPLRRTPTVQQNAVPHPSRAGLGTTASPSRFALSGHQTNPVNPPSVSASGASYIASSPSPAASGGTSVFRDARQTSPWN
ncbi:uncharacterized protein LOC114737869 [Neltuma alba]|uniref:uncharacterized protein LOC114737869 n=1 Tax=Neltuma alba TaxID=207710 RepID=UPI0010A4EBDA|nr:uncharacterized protein LOC114737869 [Prosopis alba]